MSAIRPLATIAMLMVLGIFLWTRINSPDLKEETEDALASANVPALETDLGPTSDTMQSAPPAFCPEGDGECEEELPEFAFGPAPSADEGSDITPLAKDEMAAMPELPPLPADVPQADYGDSTAAAPEAGSMTPPVPSMGASLPESAIVDQSTPEATTSDPAEALAGMSDTAPLDPAGMGLPADSTTAMDPTVSNEFATASEFAAERAKIDAALAQGELEKAHRELSKWYGDPSLSPKERDEIEALLGQLAGTVVYSTEHRLEAPHVVQPGETLETIAQQYNVPWQLLAKINSVPQPSAVTPGQELKVIRGPFSALVVPGNRMALMVADRYAGEFSVKVEGVADQEGEWVVTQKQMPVNDSKHLVLEPVGGKPGGPQVVLGPVSDIAPPSAGAIRVGPTDQEDLFDILSIGSRVLIRK